MQRGTVGGVGVRLREGEGRLFPTLFIDRG
jgi:hypothetical protein